MLSICSSRHSRRLRAPTPAGSSDCTARKRLLHLLRRVLAHRRDLFERGRKVPVFVQVADDRFGGVAHLLGDDADAQLRAQMIAQRDRRGEERLERGLLDRFRRRALVAGVQIIVEEAAEIDLVEGIGGRRRLRQRIVDRDRVVLGDHLRGRRFLGIGEQVAVDRAAVRPVVHRVGVAQNGGFQELFIGRIVELLGLEQRQKFLGRDLFPRLVEQILRAPGS